MANRFFWHSRRSRTALIILLLLISLVTATLIGLQAQNATATQRAAAESVLRDCSSLVADEVIRRSAAEVGFYGYYPLTGAVFHEIQQSGNLPSAIRTMLAPAQDARIARAASLAKGYFQMDSSEGRLTFLGEPPPKEVSDWLRETLERFSSQPGGSPYQVFHSQAGGPSRIFVAGAARAPNTKEVIAGFEVDFPSLTKWFETALNREPLVPPSLGHGRVTNAMVHVSVRDASGVEQYRLGAGPPQGLAVTKPFGDTYQGIFSGFTVEASIDPQATRQIVMGGVPPSRLPFFIGLLTVNAALIVTAILQLRREMALQQLRDEFVSSVSHELRTPLTQIRMFAETLLLDRVRTTEEHRRSLEIIDREARRLGQLVENVLQFSRMERRSVRLSREKRELAPLIQEIAEDFESAMNGGETQIETRLKSGLYANLDPDALRQILLNLLDNAVKYGKKGQRVIVGLEAGEGTAQLFVDDEGPGIPPLDRTRIFERFQRLERDRQSAIAGTGIGLSVVQDLAKRHGGRCWVVTGDHGGAKFIIELPLCAGERAREANSEGDPS